MTELNEDNVQEAQTERTQMDALADLDIGSLRKVAKALGVSASRDWDKTAYVKAIIAHQNKSIASFVIASAPSPISSSLDIDPVTIVLIIYWS